MNPPVTKKRLSRILRITVCLVLMRATLLPSSTAEWSLSAGAGWQFPTGYPYQKIYGSAAVFGGGVEWMVSRSLGIWTDIGILSQDGKLTYTGEKTHLKLLPWDVGLCLVIWRPGPVRLSCAAGIGWTWTRESNIIGTVEDRTAHWIVRGSARFAILRGLGVDAGFYWRRLEMDLVRTRIDLGGWGMDVRLRIIPARLF